MDILAKLAYNPINEAAETNPSGKVRSRTIGLPDPAQAGFSYIERNNQLLLESIIVRLHSLNVFTVGYRPH